MFTHKQHAFRSTYLLQMTCYGRALHLYMYPSPLTTSKGTFLTIKLGLGQDAATDAEAVLLIADVEGRDGRMVGDLFHRHSKSVFYPLVYCFTSLTYF